MTLSLALGLVAIIAAIVAGVSFSRHSDTAQANPSKIWVVNGQVLQTHDGGLCGGVCDPTTAAGRAKFKGTLDTIQTDSTDASGDVEVSMCAPGCSLPPPGGDTWVLAQTDGSGTPVSLNGRGLGCTPLCDGTATQVPDATDHFVVYRIANTGTHSGGDTLISTASEDAVTLDSIVMLITGGCGAPTPTNTPMGSPTGTFTATPTITPSPTPTAPPTPTATPGQGACPTVIGLETWPCLALVLKIQCASLNIPPALDAVAARSAGLTPPELLARGSLDGGLTPLVLPSDLAGIDVDANQLHEQDGVMWVVAFVGSADPVTFTTTRGSFITPISVSVGSQMTCGPAGQVTNDADCNGGTRGDGVVVARLDAMGAARGPGTVTVSQRGVAQSMAFTVVGEPQTISIAAVPSQLDTSRDPPLVSSLATAVSSGSSTVVVSADILAGRALPADIVIDPLAPPLVERVTVVSKAGGTYTLQAGKLNATGDLRLSGTANPHAVGAAVTTADTCADRYTAGGLNAALARPDRTLIIARPKDSDGTIVANAVVTFTSSNSQIAEAPVVVAPSMGLGSYGIGAPMVICGGTLPGDATVTAALARTLPPPFPGLAVDPLAGTDSHIVPLHVAIPCSDFDLNHDGRVGFPDLYALALAYNSRPGNPAWNPAADFIADSKVGFDDLYQLALHYNQKC